MAHDINWQDTRVTKKFAPHQAGARKLARRHGRTLVCVRHRHSLDGTVRYTTVELVVEQVQIQHRQPPGQFVAVRLQQSDGDTRRHLIGSGAQWDQHLAAWWITRATARRLRLLKQIVALDRV
jgi:hypothetical protein